MNFGVNEVVKINAAGLFEETVGLIVALKDSIVYLAVPESKGVIGFLENNIY